MLGVNFNEYGYVMATTFCDMCTQSSVCPQFLTKQEFGWTKIFMTVTQL